MCNDSLTAALQRYLRSTDELVLAYLDTSGKGATQLPQKILSHEGIRKAKCKELGRWLSWTNSGAPDALKAARTRAWLSMHVVKGDYLRGTQSLFTVACDQSRVAVAHPLEPRYVPSSFSCTATVKGSPAAQTRDSSCNLTSPTNFLESEYAFSMSYCSVVQATIAALDHPPFLACTDPGTPRGLHACGLDLPPGCPLVAHVSAAERYSGWIIALRTAAKKRQCLPRKLAAA